MLRSVYSSIKLVQCVRYLIWYENELGITLSDRGHGRHFIKLKVIDCFCGFRNPDSDFTTLRQASEANHSCCFCTDSPSFGEIDHSNKVTVMHTDISYRHRKKTPSELTGQLSD